MTSLHRSRTGVPALIGLLLAAVCTAVFAAPGSEASPTPAARLSDLNPTNPLVGVPWGIYRGHADGAYAAWQNSTGTNQALLAKIALRPRVIWVGHWISTGQIADQIRTRIRDFRRDNPDALVQLAMFRLWPREEAAKDVPLTAADQAAYKAWVDAAAQGIGSTKVAMILEPDLGLAWKGWRPRVRFALAKYAARVFGALPNTSVYLDASDADWLSLDQARQMLLLSGIQYVRGFALGATHYASTANNVLFGAKLVNSLAAAGVPGRHFVVDTADNGRPFTWLQFYARFPGGVFDNPNLCKTSTEVRCETLGIPPTPLTYSTAWGMSSTVQTAAARYADAFLWFGRPWLYKQASPFQLNRALALARTTRYAGP